MSESRYAILIASSNFEDKALPNLRCPENDVDGFFGVLISKGGFDDKNILKLKNKPSHEVLARANRIFKESGKEDLIILYYSGHGKLNSSGKLHLTTGNTDLGILESTSIPGEVLKTYADISPSRKVIFILDCCFSGAIGEVFASKSSIDDQLQLLSQGRGIHIISSSTGIQTSQENESDAYSVFTKYLIKGIAEGSADLNGDGAVSIDELYSYVQDQVKNEGSQEPMKWNIDVRGNPLIIATTGKIPRQKRRMELRDLLLSSQEKDILPDPLVSSALDIIAAQPSELSDLQKIYDTLLSKLLDKEIRTADFIHEWYTLGMHLSLKSNEGVDQSRKRDLNVEIETLNEGDIHNQSSKEIEAYRFIHEDVSASKQSVSHSVKESSENISEPLTSSDLHGSQANETIASKLSRLRKILILAVAPQALGRLRLDQEVREICYVLRNSREFRFIVEVRWAVRVSDLQDIMLEFEPQIVHFCGHGGGQGIILEDENGNIKEVPPEALASLFKLFSGQIDGVIFNSCYSDPSANAIIPYTNYVIGMESAIGDKDAITFSREFYRALSYGRTFEAAYEFGWSAIQLIGLNNSRKPILRKADEIHDVHQTVRQEILAQWLETRENAKRILVLAVNPTNTSQLRLGEEVRIIYDSLKGAIASGKFALEQCWGVRFGDLQEALSNFKPHIVHFAGHGAGRDGLAFEDETGKATLIKAESLVKLFKLCASHVECFILTAPSSEVQAKELSKHITYVIGMQENELLADSEALAYTTGFYRALGLNSSIQESHTSGCLELERKELPSSSTPIIFLNGSKENLDPVSNLSNEHFEHSLDAYQQQIELLINQSNNQAYSQAVNLLLEVRDLMVQLNRKSEFNILLSKFSATYKRKRNFINLLKQKGMIAS